MQTALYDSYAILPLAGSLLVQGVTAAFLVRAQRKYPDRLPDPVFFRLFAVFLSVLALGAIASAFFASLLMLSVGVFFSSLFLLLFFVLLGSSKFEKEEGGVDESLLPETEEPGEDPLIEIGQEFISRVSESMTGEINLVRLLDFINEILVKHTKADGGVIFLADDFEDVIASKAFMGKFPPPYKLPSDLPHKPIRVETNLRYAQFNLGDTIFGEVAANGKPVLIEHGDNDPRVFVNGPEDFLKPGATSWFPS
jgi:sigma-B regulation protein RsbU (phosphoserine phosphatase)